MLPFKALSLDVKSLSIVVVSLGGGTNIVIRVHSALKPTEIFAYSLGSWLCLLNGFLKLGLAPQCTRSMHAQCFGAVNLL